jgi:hypothetical protein
MEGMKKAVVNARTGDHYVADLSPEEVAARVSNAPRARIGQGRQTNQLKVLYGKLVTKGVLSPDDVPIEHRSPE